MRLKQVILNLVSNAIKFTDRGEVEIRVESRGTSIVVSVRDTGCGIRKEDQSKLFEDFRQLGGGLKGGTGLGLAISKRLVELHGGEIWVESRVRDALLHFRYRQKLEEEQRFRLNRKRTQARDICARIQLSLMVHA